jgi:hypothetical protein
MSNCDVRQKSLSFGGVVVKGSFCVEDDEVVGELGE